MIYYFPRSLSEDQNIASAKRPLEVFNFLKGRKNEHDRFIHGNARERYQANLNLIRELRNGFRPDYIYIESFNMPFFLHEIRKGSLFWLSDMWLFVMLKRYNVTFFMFYRDLYWRFPGFEIRGWKGVLKNTFHKIEWSFIAKYVDHILLPTQSIGEYLPPNKKKRLSLIPFHPGLQESTLSKPFTKKERADDCISLLYVGGVLPPFYNLEFALQLVNSSPKLKLTVCCREYEWVEVKDTFQEYSFDQVTIVHKSGPDLEDLYDSHDVFLDLRLTEGYYKHAFPYKYIESISYHLPLVIYSGGSAEQFVSENKFGWVVDDISGAIELFQELDVQDISERQQWIYENKKHVSWTERFKYLETFMK
ncbi:MAG: hypothetical protein R8G66_27735 [Cytophagales bacterium]|nr:hypothetical protein [Cytophagales bacterium]